MVDRAGHEVDSARGWLVVAAAALGMFATFGVAYSFGAFFSSMSDEFGAGSGATAVFFSVTIGLSFFLGLWTGRWVDRAGPRPVMFTAAGSLVVGLLLTAATPSIWLGYLTYGLGVGFAIACAYVPMVATVSGWFEQKRATALGVAVAGIGLGTLVGTPLAAWLIESTSWRTTYVIFALGGGGMLIIAALLAERGPASIASAAPRSISELWKDSNFRLMYIATIATSFALFVPFVFIASYATDRGIDEVSAATLVGLIGGASVLGRLSLGKLADRFDSVALFVASFVVLGSSHLIWFVADSSYALLATYSLVLGLGYGGFIALAPAVVARLFGLDGLGGTIGTLYTSAGIGSLFGPPIAGLLIDGPGYRVTILLAFGMGVVSVAALLPIFARRSEY